MEQLKHWIKSNNTIILYMVSTLIVELTAVFAVDGTWGITTPFVSLSLLAIILAAVLMIRNNWIRYWICLALLVLQSIADLVFIVLFDMNGTYFDFGMFNLRNDAFGILESIPMNFIAFFVFCIVVIVYIVYGMRCARHNKRVRISRVQRVIQGAVILVAIICMVSGLNRENIVSGDSYQKKLYAKENANYSKYGVIGNFINEVSKGLFFESVKPLDDSEIEEYLYKTVAGETENFGISKGNNVVTILAESFEWYSFIRNEEYPNALDLTEEELTYLFPNLTKLYNKSVVMNNFHSREKTDISETLSILGSYPTGAYINYDFNTNTIPYTLPNLLKEESNDDITIKSFHNGFKTFYNRDKTHPSFGFESLTDCYDMIDMAQEAYETGKSSYITMHDYLKEGERNLDSEMIDTAKDMMFPTDKRFYTYITTITMHGVYYDRANLAKWTKKLDEVNQLDPNDEMQGKLRNYVTAAMEFDHAIGLMMEDLKEKNLLENTTIVIFGDHNAYYQGMSNYVKNIHGYDTKNNYTDLYKVPFMIYDENLSHQVIDKFTCTADIVPTLTDLLGIHTYSNFYYGNSVFSDTTSLLYSRAYDIYLDDKILAKNMNNVLFTDSSTTSRDMNDFEEKANLLTEKIKYCDQIFYQDFFANANHYNKFWENMRRIN